MMKYILKHILYNILLLQALDRRHSSIDISKDEQRNLNTRDETVISHCTTININQPHCQGILINGSSVTVTNKNSLIDAASYASIQDNGISETTDSLTHTSFSSDNRKRDLDPSSELKNDVLEVDDSMVDFSQNREQWQRRANSQSHIKVMHTVKLNKHCESWMQRQNHTPDLVMDLPLVSSSSPKELTQKSVSICANLLEHSLEEDTTSGKCPENPTGPESPEIQTAAERFAKQNQCTLKKNTKIQMDTSHKSEINSKTSTVSMSSPTSERKSIPVVSSCSKPQVKAKPPVLKKPTFSVPMAVVSADVILKDQADISS